LLIVAVYFATIVNQPDVPSSFIFQLLADFTIGILISVLISWIIFPSFATMDIENRVNYALLNIEKMHMLIVESFLREDQMDAQDFLTRASTFEQMIREATSPIQTKLAYARFEPSRFLQWIFNLKRRNIINLTLQGLFSQ
jgi:uncharacterized membrane protein YccC